MNQLRELLRRLLQDLGAVDVSYALVGGLAISARCEPRFTRDIDLALSVSDDPEAEAVVGYLVRCGYRLIQKLDHRVHGRLATARMAPPAATEDDANSPEPVVDLLFASCGIEAEIVEEALPVEVFRDIAVPTARLEHLIAMKALSFDDQTRLHDRADLRLMIAEATADQLSAARNLVQLITDRGYHRDRDLAAILDAECGR